MNCSAEQRGTIASHFREPVARELPLAEGVEMGWRKNPYLRMIILEQMFWLILVRFPVDREEEGQDHLSTMMSPGSNDRRA